ncbi:MAG: hypothetical protein JO257_24830 [Deltaproteobacteria bacterium]|nr:hypothetical protein [Deltaproteobacteria bacterium]
MKWLLPLLVASTAYAEAGWELRVPERVEMQVGSGGTLPIAIAVDRGQSISKDGGVIVDLATDGVGVKKKRLSRADAVDPDADAPRFAVPIRADAAGDFTVRLHLRFWLCGPKVCKPIDARRTVAIAVAATPP